MIPAIEWADYLASQGVRADEIHHIVSHILADRNEAAKTIVTEDLYDDIIKNEVARRKLKEYCESVSWGKEIKEIIWKKL